MLDTNEFIGALDIVTNPASEELLNKIIKSFPKYTLCLPRTIINEVRRNISPAIFSQFLTVIRPIAIVDEDASVPFELGMKYELKGLKPADAFIAAYTEWGSANILVTENRHFLSRRDDLSFKVVNAENCLKILK